MPHPPHLYHAFLWIGKSDYSEFLDRTLELARQITLGKLLVQIDAGDAGIDNGENLPPGEIKARRLDYRVVFQVIRRRIAAEGQRLLVPEVAIATCRRSTTARGGIGTGFAGEAYA